MVMIQSLEKGLDKEIRSFFKKHKSELNVDVRVSDLTFEYFLEQKLLIIFTINKGLPYEIFELIQELCEFEDEEWAHMLDISTKSLSRYKDARKYPKRAHSEKIIEVAEVVLFGVEVFGNIGKLRSWLQRPNFVLGGEAPMQLLSDSYGKELVMEELVRIEYGLFA